MADAGSTDIGASLTLIRALHARWAVWWRSLSDADFARTGQVIGAPRLSRSTACWTCIRVMAKVIASRIIKTLAAGGIERASA